MRSLILAYGFRGLSAWLAGFKVIIEGIGRGELFNPWQCEAEQGNSTKKKGPGARYWPQSSLLSNCWNKLLDTHNLEVEKFILLKVSEISVHGQ